MTDDVDRATDRSAEILADALRDQARRAGMQGKTVADSATHCHDCGDRIPAVRRKAMPGCSRCVHCQQVAERGR